VLESNSIELLRRIKAKADDEVWEKPTISDFAKYFEKRFPFVSRDSIISLIVEIAGKKRSVPIGQGLIVIKAHVPVGRESHHFQ
jgi:hypothetical protein